MTNVIAGAVQVAAIALAPLVPGVIQDASLAEESHEEDLVEYPHYTRPAEYRGLTVPEVLLSGHHAQIGSVIAAAHESVQRR